MTKALVALSGGVDSTVAGWLAQKSFGKDNTEGIYLGLWGGERNNRSCSTADANAAKEAADVLGMVLREVDLTEEFQTKIVDNYRDELLQGKTPSPCVSCNSLFKIDFLINYAKQHNFDKIITGHYVGTDGRYLKRHPSSNDQSYFLWQMTPMQLSFFEFPLAVLRDKAGVRAFAAWKKLPQYNKPDSTDLCFNPKALCEDAEPIPVTGKGARPGASTKPGELTLGQRHGLPVMNDGQGPYYVTETSSTEVTIGRKEDLYVTTLELSYGALHWPKCGPDGEMEFNVQCSSRGPVHSATVKDLEVTFKEPVRAVASGQHLVFYDKEINAMVMGGGIVS